MNINRLREVLRLLLSFGHYSNRAIARLSKSSHQQVGSLKKKLTHLDFSLSDLQEQDDKTLVQVFYPKRYKQRLDRVLPDYEQHHRESLKKDKYRKTGTVLFLEYKSKYGDRAYGKTRYFELVREDARSRRAIMKQQYLPGEVLFIDYAGTKLHYRARGKEKVASIFVGCLGYSKKLFAYATPDMTSKSWVLSLSKAMTFYQGVPEVVQFDNAKAMVKQPGRVANLNDNANAFAQHYCCICDTSRVATPTDNGNAEAAVKFITNRILKLMKSDMQFFSLTEINRYLLQEVEKLNQLNFQKLNLSRNELFKEEKAALNPLPASPFHVITSRKVVRADSMYRVCHDKHYYSVPYHLRNQKLLLETTDSEIVIKHLNKEVARHKLSSIKGGDSCLDKHKKPNHLAESRKNKGVFLSWAKGISNDVQRFVEKQYVHTRNSHSRVVGKRCLTLQKLCDACGEEIFSLACHYALDHNITTPTDLALVIRAKAYKSNIEPNDIGHSNLRGKNYFEEHNHD